MEFYARAGLYDHGPGRTKYHLPVENELGKHYYSACYRRYQLNPNSTLITSNPDSPRLCQLCAKLVRW